jgi:glycosyltransferase involved in cell wall biosynthesis
MRRVVDGPFVSIITGTYNRPDYLRLALESAVTGEYQNFELIVTDNANSRQTRDVVSSFDDSRLRYRANPTNIGITGNYLAAFREMRGKYFAVLADDDLWEPRYLARLVPILEADPSRAIAFSDHYIIDENGDIDPARTMEQRAIFGRDDLREGVSAAIISLGLLSLSIHGGASAVFRTSAVDFDDFPLEVGTVFDLWLPYLAARSGGVAYYYPHPLTRYRTHRGGTNQTAFADTAKDRAFVYRRILADGLFPEFQRDLELRLGANEIDSALALLRVRRMREALVHFGRGIVLRGGRDCLVRKLQKLSGNFAGQSARPAELVRKARSLVI